METIRRNLALADMDIRTDERGRRRIFSIKFVSKEGKVYFMPQAYACGAGRMNMKEYQLRGVQPCDCKGNPEGHPYPVDIYNPQIQISAESETKRSIFREKDKTKRSKKESAQHSKSRNKSFVMTSVSAL